MLFTFKVKVIFYGLVLLQLLTVGCKATEKNEYRVKGLTEELYYALSGSWDTDVNYNTHPYEFSWGRGKWVFNSSIIIDFGTKPPEFYIGGVANWEILSLEIIEKNIYKLNLKGPWFDMKKKEIIEGENYIIIHFYNNTIWFADTPLTPIMDNGPKNIFYKISGPKKN